MVTILILKFQWIALVRKHAEVVADDEIILPVFRKFCKVQPAFTCKVYSLYDNWKSKIITNKGNWCLLHLCISAFLNLENLYVCCFHLNTSNLPILSDICTVEKTYCRYKKSYLYSTSSISLREPGPAYMSENRNAYILSQLWFPHVQRSYIYKKEFHIWMSLSATLNKKTAYVLFHLCSNLSSLYFRDGHQLMLVKEN